MSKKWIGIGCVALLLSTALLGCSSGSNNSTSASSADRMALVGEAPAADYGAYDDYAYDEAEPMEEWVESPQAGGGGEVAMVSLERKRIITTDLSLQTTEFDDGVEQIKEMADSFDGYLQNSYIQNKSMNDRYGIRYASFSARIPTGQLDAFLSAIEQSFHVTDLSQHDNDITDAYYDTEARLNSLKTQEERLLEMMEQAAELEYLLQVQTALTEVQYQIESLTSALQRMDNSVAYSTVNISLEEVVEYAETQDAPVTFGQRMNNSFGDSWSGFVSFLEGALIVLIMLLPYIIILGIIALVVVKIIRSRRKRYPKQPPVGHSYPPMQHPGVYPMPQQPQQPEPATPAEPGTTEPTEPPTDTPE